MEIQNNQNNFAEVEGLGEVNILNFKTHYKATVLMTMWYWRKSKSIDQWNIIGSSKMNSHFYGTKVPSPFNKEKSLQKMMLRQWTPMCKWSCMSSYGPQKLTKNVS